MPKTKGFILGIAKTKDFSKKRKLLKQESKNENKTKPKGQSATLLWQSKVQNRDILAIVHGKLKIE